MRLEKTIKSVLRKILVEQASPPGNEWTKIAPSEVTNFQTAGCTVMQDSDSKWYYKTSSCTPTPAPNPEPNIDCRSCRRDLAPPESMLLQQAQLLPQYMV